MVRKLKFHEAKLLKKVDFVQWKHDNNLREIQVMRRYHIQNRDDYSKYNSLCGAVKKIVNELSNLNPKDPFKGKTVDQLVDKLYPPFILSCILLCRPLFSDMTTLSFFSQLG